MAKRVIGANPDSGFRERGRSLLMSKGQLCLVAVFVAIFLLAGGAVGTDQLTVEAIREEVAICLRQGKYRKAEALGKRALAIDEKALGTEHLEVAKDLTSLAWIYQFRGKCAEAEQSLKRALAIHEKAQGMEHPEAATGLRDLAKLYLEGCKPRNEASLLKQAWASGMLAR